MLKLTRQCQKREDLMRTAVFTVIVLLLGYHSGPEAVESEPNPESEEKAPGLPVEIAKWRFAMRLPSAKWKVLYEQEIEGANRRGIYGYKRQAILDSEGRPIEPVIGFVFRPVPKDANPIIWIGIYRAKLVKAAGMELVESLNRSLFPGLPLGMGWLTTSEKGGIEHTVKLVGAIDGEVGVQVIMDSTTDVFAAVEQEFDFTLKSLRFIPPE